MNLVAVGGPPTLLSLPQLAWRQPQTPALHCDSAITHHNRNFLSSEDAIGKRFYIEQFWHFSMTNFTPKKGLFFSPKAGWLQTFLYYLSFPFPHQLPSSWVSFLIKAKTSNGAMHLKLHRSLIQRGTRVPKAAQQCDSDVPHPLSGPVWPVCSDIVRTGFTFHNGKWKWLAGVHGTDRAFEYYCECTTFVREHTKITYCNYLVPALKY